MKLIAVLALIGAASATLEVRINPLDDITVPAKEKFGFFKTAFNKAYGSVEKELHALENFIGNEKIILEHNAGNSTYVLGHNEFSDLSWPEFKQLYVSGPMKSTRAKNVVADPEATADAVDWVAKGAVTPVKNQGQCGSCWAFSTTGSVEGAYQIAGNSLTSFSEQDLVSCASSSGNQGCNGGLMDDAFTWIESNGIATESAYPYTSGSGTTGTCKKTAASAKVSGYQDVAQGSESGLKASIGQAPTSVAIEADKSAFQLYKSGVFDSTSCGKQLDHGVLAVGWGTQDGKDYYKVKNSWGATWGMSGYILMVQGKDMCGIADSASRPTGATPMGPTTPTPAPTPAPGPAGTTHYGDPNAGACMSDEEAIQIQGVGGAVCSPACTGILKMGCPKDVPAGVTAAPQCALQDATTSDKYCALICSPSLPIADQKLADAACGGSNLSCKAISGVGICTYDS